MSTFLMGIVDSGEGQIEVTFEYDGGFDPNSHAHQQGKLVEKFLAEINGQASNQGTPKIVAIPQRRNEAQQIMGGGGYENLLIDTSGRPMVAAQGQQNAESLSASQMGLSRDFVAVSQGEVLSTAKACDSQSFNASCSSGSSSSDSSSSSGE